MRIILEKKEVLMILGKHFDTTLSEDNVVIRTDPVLEIELKGIVMNEPAAPVASVKDSAAQPVNEPASSPREDIEHLLDESEELKRADRNTLKAVPSSQHDEVS